MRFLKFYLISLFVVVLDQAAKLATYWNMVPHEEIFVFGEWFRIHYLLNSGMAFGIQIDMIYGKIILSVIRILATVGIGSYIYYLIKRLKSTRMTVFFCLILGGAVGNLIDSIFYGVLLDNAPSGVITPWLHGQVIDMLFFPLFDFYIPEWSPLWAGNYFLFFSPVFNLADSFIFIGFISLLLFTNYKN